MEVSFADCKRELLKESNRKALAAYQAWRARRGWDEVITFVEGFTHRHLFELSSSKLRKVIDRSEHALGNVQKEEAIKSVENFTCPFALQHIFHGYLEDTGVAPTWQDFNSLIHKEARGKWLEHLRDRSKDFPEVRELIESYGRDEAWHRIKRAVRWRLGKFYLSAMRELDLLVRLRERDVPLRYHLLADVLLRVDFWTPSTFVCIYFENKNYRSRKHPTEHFFNEADVLHQTIQRQGFGRIWPATEESVQQLVQQLKERDASRWPV